MKIYCPNCEAENAEDAPMCGLCGYLLNATAPVTVEPPAKPARRFRLPKPRIMTALKAVGIVAFTVFVIVSMRSFMDGDIRPDVSILKVTVFVVGFAVVVALVATVWFYPVRVAEKRNHPNKTAIFVLTVLFGWTFLGWGIALIWALSNPPPYRQSEPT